MGLFSKTEQMTLEMVKRQRALALQNRLRDLLGHSDLCVTDWGHSSFMLEWNGAVTFQCLNQIAEFFGTEDIDVEGTTGSGSYYFGFEAKVHVFKPTQNYEGL